MKDYFTLEDFELKGKTVLLRADLNAPYNKEERRIEDCERIREHAKTIQFLIENRAKVVILAHQGRKGDEDFTSLEQHSKLLSKHLGKEVKFVDDVIGERALNEIKNLKEGEALLLDNVRFLDEETQEKGLEEHAKSKLVQTLAPLADFFVQDAFSASHRSHASIVGFALVLPTIAGKVMEKELSSVEKVLQASGNVFILGGAKPDDCLNIMEHFLENRLEFMEKILTCGTVGEILLTAKGYKLGEPTLKFFEQKGFLDLIPQARKLLEKYEMKIEIPKDVAVEENGKRKEVNVKELPCDAMILDIGSETIRNYIEIIRKARSIVMKGPPGVYEKKGFEIGTREILEAIASSKAFSLIGGGDTGLAIEKLGIEKEKFSYISLGGGALITYLSGKPMSGIEALKLSYQKFKGKIKRKNFK
ncbi:MAG: phosphoglycerate kinase [Candidatus Aenigmatarchaeota archaeon]